MVKQKRGLPASRAQGRRINERCIDGAGWWPDPWHFCSKAWPEGATEGEPAERCDGWRRSASGWRPSPAPPPCGRLSRRPAHPSQDRMDHCHHAVRMVNAPLPAASHSFPLASPRSLPHRPAGGCAAAHTSPRIAWTTAIMPCAWLTLPYPAASPLFPSCLAQIPTPPPCGRLSRRPAHQVPGSHGPAP